MSQPPNHPVDSVESVPVKRNRRYGATLAICSLAAAILTAVMYFDGTIVRAYFGFDLPYWAWDMEQLASKWGHLIAIGIGAVLVATRNPRWLLHLAITVLVGSLVVFFIKFGVGRARPCDAGDPFLFFGPNTVHDGYPSGHSVAIWGAVFVVMYCYPRFGWFWLVIGLVIVWARLHALAHYAGDMLAAAMIALGIERASYAGVFEYAKARRIILKATPWIIATIISPLVLWPIRTPMPSRMTEPEYDAVVHELYTRILSRPVDDREYQLWMGKLHEVRVVSDPLFQFAVSGEFYRSIREVPTSEGRAIEIYRRLLDRRPTADELRRAERLLDDPGTLKWGVRLVATRLILSGEYLDRFGPFKMPGDPRTSEEKP